MFKSFLKMENKIEMIKIDTEYQDMDNSSDDSVFTGFLSGSPEDTCSMDVACGCCDLDRAASPQEYKNALDDILDAIYLKMNKMKIKNLKPTDTIKKLDPVKESDASEMVKEKTQLLRTTQDYEERLMIINSLTYQRFKEARKNDQIVTKDNLKEWAKEFSMQFLHNDPLFEPSKTWLRNFKRKYEIERTKVVRYIQETDSVALDKTLDFIKKD